MSVGLENNSIVTFDLSINNFVKNNKFILTVTKCILFLFYRTSFSNINTYNYKDKFYLSRSTKVKEQIEAKLQQGASFQTIENSLQFVQKIDRSQEKISILKLAVSAASNLRNSNEKIQLFNQFNLLFDQNIVSSAQPLIKDFHKRTIKQLCEQNGLNKEDSKELANLTNITQKITNIKQRKLRNNCKPVASNNLLANKDIQQIAKPENISIPSKPPSNIKPQNLQPSPLPNSNTKPRLQINKELKKLQEQPLSFEQYINSPFSPDPTVGNFPLIDQKAAKQLAKECNIKEEEHLLLISDFLQEKTLEDLFYNPQKRKYVDRDCTYYKDVFQKSSPNQFTYQHAFDENVYQKYTKNYKELTTIDVNCIKQENNPTSFLLSLHLVKIALFNCLADSEHQAIAKHLDAITIQYVEQIVQAKEHKAIVALIRCLDKLDGATFQAVRDKIRPYLYYQTAETNNTRCWFTTRMGLVYFYLFSKKIEKNWESFIQTTPRSSKIKKDYPNVENLDSSSSRIDHKKLLETAKKATEVTKKALCQKNTQWWKVNIPKYFHQTGNIKVFRDIHCPNIGLKAEYTKSTDAGIYASTDIEPSFGPYGVSFPKYLDFIDHPVVIRNRETKDNNKVITKWIAFNNNIPPSLFATSHFRKPIPNLDEEKLMVSESEEEQAKEIVQNSLFSDYRIVDLLNRSQKALEGIQVPHTWDYLSIERAQHQDKKDKTKAAINRCWKKPNYIQPGFSGENDTIANRKQHRKRTDDIVVKRAPDLFHKGGFTILKNEVVY